MTAAADLDPRELFGTGPRGVLVTLKSDGRPQLSVVGYLYDAVSQKVLISATNDRAKVHNLRRDPRASFQVSTPDLGAYAVGDGVAQLSPVASDAHDELVDQLVGHYRALKGEHSDWADFRRAMVRERRLLIRIRLTHVYGWHPAR